MTSASDINGKISICLNVSGGKVGSVNITNTRSKNPARVFVGYKPEVVPAFAGTMFSLCGRAQTIASLMAIEDATGLHASAERVAARNILRLAEMASQSAMRLCMNWPELLGLEASPNLVRSCFKSEEALKKAMFGADDWTASTVPLQPDVKATSLITRNLKRDICAAIEIIGAALQTALADQGLNRFGANNAPVEIEEGALKRRWNSQPVAEARDRFGVGLAARLEARIVDIQTIADELVTATNTLGPADAVTSLSLVNGQGQASVETARGPLLHKVSIKNRLIEDYQIIAPTDVNFLPGGPVAQGLLAMDFSDNLARAAEMHVIAIDPCVECLVEVHNA